MMLLVSVIARNGQVPCALFGFPIVPPFATESIMKRARKLSGVATLGRRRFVSKIKVEAKASIRYAVPRILITPEVLL